MASATDILPKTHTRHPQRKRNWAPWLFVLPCLLVIIAVTVFPTLYSLGLSLFKWEATLKAKPFVGLANYAAILNDARFLHAAGVTALLVVAGVLIEAILGFAIAQFVISDNRGHRAFVALMLLPVMVMPVVVGYTWRLLWDAQYGPINQMIGWVLGREFQYTWLGNPATALLALLVTEVWQWTPFMFMIFYAGLATLDLELYDAAKIDGANTWQQLWSLTLPLMKPIIYVAVLIRGLDAIKAFDLIFTQTNGGPGTSTETLSFYIYKVGFQFFRLGSGAAMSFVVLIFLSILLTFLMRYMRSAWQR